MHRCMQELAHLLHPTTDLEVIFPDVVAEELLVGVPSLAALAAQVRSWMLVTATLV